LIIALGDQPQASGGHLLYKTAHGVLVNVMPLQDLMQQDAIEESAEGLDVGSIGHERSPIAGEALEAHPTVAISSRGPPASVAQAGVVARCSAAETGSASKSSAPTLAATPSVPRPARISR
jgi:hypothetical protein